MFAKTGCKLGALQTQTTTSEDNIEEHRNIAASLSTTFYADIDNKLYYKQATH